MQFLTSIDPEWTSLVIAGALVLALAIPAWLLAGVASAAARTPVIRRPLPVAAAVAVRDVARAPERLLGRVEQGIGRCRLAHQHQLAAGLQLEALELELDRLKSDIAGYLPGRVAARLVPASTASATPFSLAVAA
jgi:hypothetical protein